MIWNLKQLCEAVEGVMMAEVLGEDPVEFERVITDSRAVGARDLYVAIKGTRFDGHDFINDAIQQGATGLLVSEPKLTPVPAVLVEDTRIALGQFAAWHRLQCPLKKLFAVTGSNGKTTTKSMLLSILQELAPTLATQGNLNNDFGVPRTLLEINEQHEYAVIEMGANHPHEIRYLTQLAQPDIAIITMAGEAHLEGFGSLQGVISTKGEIFEGLAEGGTGIINLDSPGAEDWLATCALLNKQTLTFGRHPEAQVRLQEVQQKPEGIVFEVKLPDAMEVAVQMSVIGPHNAMNATAAIAACWAAGLSWRQIEPGLVKFSAFAGRLQVMPLSHGSLIDDSYNANPASMKAGMDALVALPGAHIVCLGAMAELGEFSQQAHESVVRYALAQNIAHVFLYGAAFQHVESQNPRVTWFATHAELAEAAIQQLKTYQRQNEPLNILVKGSRSANMEVVAQAISHFDQTLSPSRSAAAC